LDNDIDETQIKLHSFPCLWAFLFLFWIGRRDTVKSIVLISYGK
jgi:hypothetical protein